MASVCGQFLHREVSCDPFTFTGSSANTGGNSTCTMVATSLASSPSIFVSGVTYTPGFEGFGGSTVNPVVTVV